MPSTSRTNRTRADAVRDQSASEPFFSKARKTPVQQKTEPFFAGKTVAVQAKPNSDQPGDQYEHEADAVAEKAFGQPGNSTLEPFPGQELTHMPQKGEIISRQPDGNNGKGQDEVLRKKKFNEILAKGDKMTSGEAWQAKELLFLLSNDEFKTALKALRQHSSFYFLEKMLKNSNEPTIESELQEEVVIPTVLLKPAPNTIDEDFAQANILFNPHKIQVEKGPARIVEEVETLETLGGKSAVPVPSSGKSKEMNTLIEKYAAKGRITAFWVQDIQLSGKDTHGKDVGGVTVEKALASEDTIIIVDASKRYPTTFAHEIGHALGLSDLEGEANKDNLMYFTMKWWENPKNELTANQLEYIRTNLNSYLEQGKKENETQKQKTGE